MSDEGWLIPCGEARDVGSPQCSLCLPVSLSWRGSQDLVLHPSLGRHFWRPEATLQLVGAVWAGEASRRQGWPQVSPVLLRQPGTLLCLLHLLTHGLCHHEEGLGQVVPTVCWSSACPQPLEEAPARGAEEPALLDQCALLSFHINAACVPFVRISLGVGLGSPVCQDSQPLLRHQLQHVTGHRVTEDTILSLALLAHHHTLFICPSQAHTGALCCPASCRASCAGPVVSAGSVHWPWVCWGHGGAAGGSVNTQADEVVADEPHETMVWARAQAASSVHL